jgi:hypothetical protein
MSGTVTVQGKAIVAAQPDEVELLLEISHLARSHQDALSEVARRSQALEAIFERLGIQRAEWTTSGVAVAEQNDWENGRQVFRGYRASNRITVRLDDSERIGRLMNEATTGRKPRSTAQPGELPTATRHGRRPAVKRLSTPVARRKPMSMRWERSLGTF